MKFDNADYQRRQLHGMRAMTEDEINRLAINQAAGLQNSSDTGCLGQASIGNMLDYSAPIKLVKAKKRSPLLLYGSLAVLIAYACLWGWMV